MKKLSHGARIFLLLLLGPFPCPAEVVVYPAPEGEDLSADYALEVDGQPVDICLAHVTDVKDSSEWLVKPGQLGGPYSFASFDMSGPVTVRVTSLKSDLNKLVIRPVAYGIKPTVNGNTATFTLEKPAKLSIEPNGRLDALLLFANPLEAEPPRKDDPDVIYFGPGMHHQRDIRVGSNQTLYIAGGAVVKGSVDIENSRNVTIRGRGILCGNDWAWRKGPGNMIGIQRSSNVTIEGIILRGSWGWTIVPRHCDSVNITNIKLCNSKNPNDDGINPVNSQRVTIRDCFIRTDDDCIAMKGSVYEEGRNNNVEDITVEDCLLWCDRARIFLLGHESRAKYMRRIKLRNLHVLHHAMTPFLFEPGEEMSIEDVLVENVTVNAEYWKPNAAPREFANWDLITLRPVVNQYMHKQVPGRISDVHFKNVHVDGSTENGGYNIWVSGKPNNHGVSNVTFEDVTRFGQRLTKDSPSVRIEGDTRNIRFLK